MVCAIQIIGAGLVFVALCAMAPAGDIQVPTDTTAEGRALYVTHCVRCHGEDGAKGKWGAKDLRASRMAAVAITRQVREGKGIMPSFERKLTPEQLAALVQFVPTLRTAQ
ncbi:MAG TPA: cytochrome c [Flavobacteriales bacterium]|jgi:mono/diheme cytochrome c family protein|nr:cytochrome c [Flavobacteriales bacterium]